MLFIKLTKMMENIDITQKSEYTLGFDGADASSYAHVQNENMETEVDADDIDLKSFRLKNELESNIWDGEDNLDLNVRNTLLEISDDFWETCNIRWVKPVDAVLTGSICNFNWSSYSDIDLHLVVDFSKIHPRKDFVKEYFDDKKNEWNDSHNSLKFDISHFLKSIFSHIRHYKCLEHLPVYVKSFSSYNSPFMSHFSMLPCY